MEIWKRGRFSFPKVKYKHGKGDGSLFKKVKYKRKKVCKNMKFNILYKNVCIKKNNMVKYAKEKIYEWRG